MLAAAGLPIYGQAPGRNRPRLDQLAHLLENAKARAEKIAGHEDRFDPHELHRLADAARDLAAQLDRLAQPAEPMDEDYLCIAHGARRDVAGRCLECRRPDLETTV